ncbi:magnesium transporter MRS2 homolog, mitochondrial-like [Styela clava]
MNIGGTPVLHCMRKILCHSCANKTYKGLFIHTKRCLNGSIQRTCSGITSSVLSQKKSTFQVYHIDPDGGVANYEVPKLTFYNELGLSARDLRFQHSHMLCARSSKMILRIQKLKAVICQNALLLIDSPALSSPKLQQSVEDDKLRLFCKNLPDTLTENKLHTKHLPFEYRVLEAILSFGINSMTADLQELEPTIEQLLQTLTDPTNMDVDRSLVHILLQYNSMLNKFSTIVKEYCQMLDDILEYEEDLKDLCISVEPRDNIDSSSLYTVYVFTPNAIFGNDDHTDNHLHHIKPTQKQTQFRINLLDEMELLLDSYLKEGEEIVNKVTELKQAIDDSNSAILINLDSHRNMLLKYELQLTMGMFALTICGMVGVAFGMNLNSSLEEDAKAFWIITGSMYFFSGIVWMSLLRYMKRSPKSLAMKGINVDTKQFTPKLPSIRNNGSKPSISSVRTYCSLIQRILKRPYF